MSRFKRTIATATESATHRDLKGASFGVLALLWLLPATAFGQGGSAAATDPAEIGAIPDSAITAPAVLKPGDAVQLTVWRRDEVSGEFLVTADGTLAHPLLTSLVVADIPLAEVDHRVREFLLQLEAKPEFVVQPLFRVAIGGEVRSPALYRLPPETTVAEAVATAGGATPTGRVDNVRVIRGDETFVVDLSRPGATGMREAIRSGDQIMVERRTAIVRDYLAPISSVVSALGVLLGLMLR